MSGRGLPKGKVCVTYWGRNALLCDQPLRLDSCALIRFTRDEATQEKVVPYSLVRVGCGFRFRIQA